MDCLVIIRQNHQDYKEASDGEMFQVHLSGWFSRMSPLENLLSPSKHSTQSNVNVKHIPYSRYPERLFIYLLVLIVIRFTARHRSNYYKLHVAGN